MAGKKWLVAVGIGLALASSGCVTCCHESAKAVIEAGPDCPIPACDRGKVYAVLISGCAPLGLDCLRDRLAEHGFAKVYCGNMCHAGWFKRELERVYCDDPCARFVIVGYELGCSDANGIAIDVMAAGVPVDAVILMNPVATGSLRGCPARRILVTSGYDCPATPHTERRVVCGASHFTLPSHPQTLDAVLGVLEESAAMVEHPPVHDGPTWQYEHAPPAWVTPPIPPGFPSEWLFLEDMPGPHMRPLSPVPPDLLPVPIPPALVPRGGFPPRWMPPMPPVVIPLPPPPIPAPPLLPEPRQVP